ncbi:hypothetical protein KR100_04065 [Synechococcus sp. KORDI-100]|uniref:hypothetical protein n=1 Tax=Synechococcus sp. KORDI-100 TaxID=1280380 RepID=UPI0004E07E9D|nr:hypothetical protein [Synechococcus sp. KORDI-100]AII42542.1 hypothetical protein KR100_04065 [Synechococcus sp. KORDI-100]
MRLITPAALLLGLSLGGVISVSAGWKGTIGEPLRDSSVEAIKLADHLRSIGATFYGAWTCPACFRQMNLFGKQAGAEVPYIECRKPKQLPEQAAECTTAKIRAYPTWVMPDGSRREGIQSLADLASWSGLR